MKYLFIFFCLTATNTFSQTTLLDSSFNDDGIVLTPLENASAAYSVAVQQDGRIVVSGNDQIGYGPRLTVLRYNSNGTLDPTFADEGKFILPSLSHFGEGTFVAVQPDNKILIGTTYVDTVTQAVDMAVIRLDTNGTFDETFDDDGWVHTDIANSNNTCYALAIQTDSKIVALGYEDSASNKGIALVRYNPDGSLDDSFGNNGKVITDLGDSYDECRSLSMQQDGKIVIAGYTDKYNDDPLVIRYLSNGALDSTFGNNGISIILTPNYLDFGYDAAIQPDGKIVLSGYKDVGNSYYMMVYRLYENGILDSSFDGDGIKSITLGNFDFGVSVAVQTDYRIVVGGHCRIDSLVKFAIVRLNYNGTYDSTFSTDGIEIAYTGGVGCIGWSMAIQPDGKYILCGTSFPDDFSSNIAVLRFISGYHVGIDNISSSANSLQIFPNPFRENFTVVYNLDHHSDMSIELYSVDGRIQKEIYNVKDQHAGINSTQISLQNFPCGLYFIRLTTDNNILTSKVLKQF